MQVSSASIWTMCAGDPPEGGVSSFAQSLHTRWGTGREAISTRRKEDIASCTQLKASYRHFDVPDCIYRQAHISKGDGDRPVEHLYPSEASIFGPIHPSDRKLIDWLSKQLETELPSQCQIVCPLALGGHVDHQVVRAAVEHSKRPIWYYADYPYALACSHEIEALALEGWERRIFPISSDGLTAWQGSIAAHRSQINSFWSDLSSMREAINTYSGQNKGIVLWK